MNIWKKNQIKPYPFPFRLSCLNFLFVLSLACIFFGLSIFSPFSPFILWFIPSGYYIWFLSVLIFILFPLQNLYLVCSSSFSIREELCYSLTMLFMSTLIFWSFSLSITFSRLPLSCYNLSSPQPYLFRAFIMKA